MPDHYPRPSREHFDAAISAGIRRRANGKRLRRVAISIVILAIAAAAFACGFSR